VIIPVLTYAVVTTPVLILAIPETLRFELSIVAIFDVVLLKLVIVPIPV
jgi:hypothetical protein